MCVDVYFGEKPVKKIIVYKLFMGGNRKGLKGINFGGPYKLKRLYKSPVGPGFQAFAHEADAKGAIENSGWLRNALLCEVAFFAAKRGTIERMDSYSSGRQGWIAPRMKIIRKLK